MKSLYLTTIILIASTINVAGQDWKIEFLSDSITTSEFDKTYQFAIPFSIQKLKSDAESLTLQVGTLYELEATDGNDYTIVTKEISINAESYDTNNAKTESITIQIIMDNKKETEEKAIIGFLIGDTAKILSEISSFLLVLESEEPQYVFDSKNPFRIALGSNFDLLDGLSSNDLYAEVSFRDRNLLKRKMPISKIKRWIGLEAGVYQSLSATDELDTTSTIELNRQQIERRAIRIGNTVNDSTEITTFRLNYTLLKSQSQNLGLFFNPTFLSDYDLNNDGKGDLAIGWGIYLEAVRRDISSSYTFEDTLSTTTEFIPNNSRRIDTYQRLYPNESPDTFSISSTYYDRFYGISFPVYYENKYGEFYFNFANGWGVFKSRNSQTSLIDVPKFFNQPLFKEMYYITKWKIIEKKSGVQFAGEFRGFYSTDRDNIITLSLSKVFDLTKLLSF